MGNLLRLHASVLYTSSSDHLDQLREHARTAVIAVEAGQGGTGAPTSAPSVPPEQLQAPLRGGNANGAPLVRALVHVEVVALVTRPETRESEASNSFVFTFAAPPGMALPAVLPHTSEQVVEHM